jgi:hypothetical protein
VSGSGFVLVGVVGSLLPVTVERAVDAIEAELGVNFESGRGPEGISGLFNSCVDVTLGLKLGLTFLVAPRTSDLTDSAADPNPVFKTQILFPLFLRRRDAPLHRIPTEHARA